MTTAGKIVHRFVFAASLGLVCAGVASAYIEASSYLSVGVTPKESFMALAGNQQSRGFSIASSRLILDNCNDALVGVYGRLQSSALRTSVATTCLKEADATASAMPSFSYAWLIGAKASQALDDADGVVTRLRQSQMTGPTEQWLAEIRVAVAEDNFDHLPIDVQALNDRDLALLVASYRGVASIARRYVDDPPFRSRISTIVEQLPEQEQRRFVINVEAAAQTASPR